MSTKRQIIIDTDIGVDDAYAIVLALLEESVEVVALTCVAGNVDLPSIPAPLYLSLALDLHSPFIAHIFIIFLFFSVIKF